jgi:hypothetical protein
MENRYYHGPGAPEETPVQRPRARYNYWRITFLLCIVFLLVAGGIYGYRAWWPQSTEAQTSNTFQAIFMQNGQVYFGKITQSDSEYVTLEHVYYIQSASQSSATQNAAETQTTGTEISLVRLGSELHAPESKLYINKDHIMFYEDLRPDSQVLKSILSNEQK